MALLEYVTKEAFAPFGTVIEHPDPAKGGVCVVEREENDPWRIGIYRYSNHSIQQFECHPYSKESFEPLKGITVLLVAEHDTPEDYHAFLLDKPICLKKGVWHQVLSLTEVAEVKITENLEVAAEFYDHEKPISIGTCI